MIILGIDVGVGGALAWLNEHRHLLRCEDMPTTTITSGKNTRQEVHPGQLIAMLREFHQPDLALIEEPIARPLFSRSRETGERMRRTPGAMGMLALGDSFGTVRASVAGCGIPIRRLLPAEWKRAMGVGSDPAESLRLAAEQFPNQADVFKRKKDNGRSDSALIALYGLRFVKL